MKKVMDRLIMFIMVLMMTTSAVRVQAMAYETEEMKLSSTYGRTTFSEDGLTASYSGIQGGFDNVHFSNHPKSSGKWYLEIHVSGNIEKSLVTLSGASAFMYYLSTGVIFIGDDRFSGKALRSGDTVGMAFDYDNKHIAFYVNGVLQASGYTKIITKEVYPLVQLYEDCTVTTRIAENSFKYGIPDGYLPYNVKEGSIIEPEPPAQERELHVLLEPQEIIQLSLSHNLAENLLYEWESMNPTIAEVDADGKVTGISEGTVLIYCRDTAGAYEDYIPVKVLEGAAEIRLAVHLQQEESRRLWLSDDEPIEINWSSWDSSVVTVDSQGRIAGVSHGLAIVEGTASGETFRIYVRVE